MRRLVRNQVQQISLHGARGRRSSSNDRVRRGHTMSWTCFALCVARHGDVRWGRASYTDEPRARLTAFESSSTSHHSNRLALHGAGANAHSHACYAIYICCIF